MEKIGMEFGEGTALYKGGSGKVSQVIFEQRAEGSLCLPESESSRHWKQQVQGQGQTVFPHRQEARVGEQSE